MDRSESKLPSSGKPVQAYETPSKRRSRPPRHVDFHEGLCGADFDTLLTESTRHGIPSVNIGEIGVGKTVEEYRQELSVLGGGLTAKVVRHITNDKTKMVLAPNTVVALKIFQLNPSGDDLSEKTARKLVYGNILREVRAFGQISLSGHPNVVQLLFLGWRTDNPFPVLGMELGQHGSLGHMIESPGPGLSSRQKNHITVDIALGLYAIHRAGFAHGDLKPENVLILSHADPGRQVIAKITDFGGSFQTLKEDGGKPFHTTPTWSAPEVLNDDSDVDWERADVYSYGLIVGSMWGRAGGAYGAAWLQHPSSCFLKSYVLASMERQDVHVYFWYMKSQNAVTPLLAETFTQAGIDDMSRAELLGLLKPTLQAYFWLRPDTHGLMSSLTPLAARLGRNVREEKDATVTGFSRSSAGAEGRLSPLAWTRLAEFVDIFEQQILLEVEDKDRNTGCVPATDDIPGHFDETVSPTKFLKRLYTAFKRLSSEKFKLGKMHEPDDVATKARLSYLMAATLLVHPSTVRYREKGIDWMRDAALHGNEPAICLATLMLEGTHLQSSFPMRLFLSLLALSHSNRAMEILSIRWPSLSKLVREVILERPLAYQKAGKKINIAGADFFMSRLKPYLIKPHPLKRQLTLRESIAFGAVEEVERILHGTVIASDWDEVLPGLLHELSSLPDAEAASFASDAYKKGAKLDHLSTVESPLMKGFMDDSTHHFPLSSAIKRGKPLLAAAIFCIHVEFDVPVQGFFMALQLSFSLLYHEIGEMLLQLYYQNSALCQDSPELSEAMGDPIWQILSLTQNGNSPWGLERRAMHGGEHEGAYAKTLQLILAEGVDPTQGSEYNCPLACALRFDDIITVKLYIQHAQDQGCDILAYLKDPANSWQEGVKDPHTALRLCVELGCIRCLEYLLSEFPQLLAMSNDELIYVACAYQPDTDVLRLLLEAGVDVVEPCSMGLTSLYYALSQVNTAAADMIERYCSEEELRTLLRRDPDTGRSIFSALLYVRKGNVINRPTFQTPRMMDSFQWLVDHNGAHFNPSFLHETIDRTRPSSQIDQLAELDLFELLLDQFPDEMEIENRRRPLLYRAARNGHAKIVSNLITRGYNVDVTMGSAWLTPEIPAIEDATALVMVSFNKYGSGIPPSIVDGSVDDVKAWQKDIEDITLDLARESNHAKDYHSKKTRQILAEIEEQLTKAGGINELLLQMNVDKEGVMNGKYDRALSQMPTDSLSSWPAPPPHLSSSNSSSSSARLERHEPHPTASGGAGIWEWYAKPKFQDERLQGLKAQEKADYKNLEEHLAHVRSVARTMEWVWRLPPHWKVLCKVWNKKDQGGWSALYQDCRTGETTFNKPKLWRGEGLAPSESVESSQAVIGGTPTLRLRRPQDNKGKKAVRPDQEPYTQSEQGSSEAELDLFELLPFFKMLVEERASKEADKDKGKDRHDDESNLH